MIFTGFGLPSPILLAAGVILLFLIRAAARRRHMARRLRSAAGLLIWFLLGLAVFDLIPEALRPYLEKFTAAALLLVLSLAVSKLAVWLLYDLLFALRRREVADIIKDLVTALLFSLAAAIIIKEVLSINLASFIATSAVVSIILGLALQDTLANMFAGLSLQMEKPFAIGDWIAFDKFVGHVVEVSWRTTTIETFSRDQVVIPNSLIAKSPVTNYYRPTKIHERNLEIPVSREFPPNEVKNALLDALRQDDEISWETAPEIRTVDFGENAIRYRIRFYITDFKRYRYIEDRVLTRAWYYLRRARITVPYPVRHVQLESAAPEADAAAKADHEKRTAEALAKAPFLSPLSSEEKLSLARQVKPYLAFRGETVILQGDPGDSCFIILSGSAEVSVRAPEGERTVGVLNPGDVFGEMSLLTGAARSATVKAAADLEVLPITKAQLSRILAGNPKVAEGISAILAARQMALDKTKSESADDADNIHRHTLHLVQRIRDFFEL